MYSAIVSIGIGGALGALARVFLMRLFPNDLFNIPLRILMANCIGCFTIGILTGIFTFFWEAPINVRHFLIQGFLGGFTTFSSFALEFGLLHEKGEHWISILYLSLSVGLGIFFFFFGLRFIRLFA